MCLAVPVKVISTDDNGMARVQVGHGENYMEVSTLLLPEVPRAGDYVIVHAGFVLRSIDAEEAEESLRIFREIAKMEVNESRELGMV